MRGKGWALALIVALVAGGAWALIYLFEISTAGGDVFPTYSSLRTDPQGTKALYDSLGQLDGYRVERSFQPWATVDAGDAAVLMLKESAYTWRIPGQDLLTDFEKRARKGARLIVALQGERGLTPLPKTVKERNVLADRWNLRIEAAKNGRTVVFVPFDDAWKVLQKRDGQPTAVAREFGSGTVVLMTDSFPFSNEALRLHRDTALVVRALGDRRHVIFEESHLGTVLSGSVGQLLRRYRLEGAALALVLLAILFLWRSASTLVPARGETQTKTIQGRGESEALASLLRRGMTPATAGATVLGIWRKSAALLPAVGADRRARIERELEQTSGKELLAAWRRAHDLLHRRT